jgi:hypothetical protein
VARAVKDELSRGNTLTRVMELAPFVQLDEALADARSIGHPLDVHAA